MIPCGADQDTESHYKEKVAARDVGSMSLNQQASQVMRVSCTDRFY